jgi:hypothetical protein
LEQKIGVGSPEGSPLPEIPIPAICEQLSAHHSLKIARFVDGKKVRYLDVNKKQRRQAL